MARIETKQLGAEWNHTVDVRGEQIPLLSPLEAEADEGALLPGGLLNLHRRLWAWLRKILWGKSSLDHARAAIAQILAEEHRDLVKQMTGGEVMRLHAIYTALQREWYEAITREVQATVGSGIRDQASGASEVRAPSRGGQHEPAPPAPLRMPLQPGRPLPQFMGGHAWGRLKTDDAVIRG